MKNFINNWFLADMDPKSPYGVRIALSQAKNIAVCGELNNRIVAVADIAEFDTSHIVTKKNTQYELGKIHSDFNEMLLAEERKIPILDSWEITEVDDLFDNMSGMHIEMELDDYIDCYNKRSHHRGYILSGFHNDKVMEGEIIAQRSNFIVLKCYEPFYGISRILNTFVVWPNAGSETAKKLVNGRFKEEVSIEGLENCFSMPCRPVIQRLSY